MPLDPASVAALVEQARSRTFDGVFEITAEATDYRLSGQGTGLPAAESVRPLSAATARLYSWRANYRRRLLSGSLVADVAFDTIARGLLAQQALDYFDQVERRYPPVYVFGERVND